ncbi:MULTISPECIES: sugar ABC transporter permease [unclassified Clostridium]|uniref:carbohydrate ABC transporter permease n=1 Tax=unclassified Clostridium TaxID=2614128 RepID=UPI00029798BF|nr:MULTISPECIES: sugar ABC transporter permease [unclassified Clostridium]EKQ56477.1 MAG: permease component of ABC-type sugar transporter [Clostridium sp. Maddingley MBC34-26]
MITNAETNTQVAAGTNNSKNKLSFSSLPYNKQKIIISVLFLMVPVTLLIVFTYLPAIAMAGYSFTDWDGITKTKDFVGLKNYKLIMSDVKYFTPLFVSFYYFVASFIQIGLGIIIAYLVSFGCKFSNLFKGVYFFPSLINSVAISFVFVFFFQPDSTLDTVLKMLGLGGFIHYWLQDQGIINISLAFVSVWRYIGYNIVMFSAAMASISSDILEAARVDGANKLQQLRYIIIPGISTILGLQLFLSLTGALSAFETPYIMTGGGNGSMTFIIQTVQYAFQNHRVGLASAMAMVLLAMCIIITSIQNAVMKKKGM